MAERPKPIEEKFRSSSDPRVLEIVSRIDDLSKSTRGSLRWIGVCMVGFGVGLAAATNIESQPSLDGQLFLGAVSIFAMAVNSIQIANKVGALIDQTGEINALRSSLTSKYLLTQK